MQLFIFRVTDSDGNVECEQTDLLPNASEIWSRIYELAEQSPSASQITVLDGDDMIVASLGIAAAQHLMRRKQAA